ncbi:uncharacterized protein LOC123541844 [Mercenaria mercenaria]|uniref:uncharacterized protein LOC123541844 n=1 Tax=Mercenaria mercenaria TaxID=6596 RepID=UPI00234E8D75|nr:uncharacterized protein LOC123541844 [Mercenaria mercenaria]
MVAGSTAEGISQPYSRDSDIDIMTVLTNMIIYENFPDTKSFKKGGYVLQMERDKVVPGYTMIKCIGMKSRNMPYISQIAKLKNIKLFEKDGCYFLRHCCDVHNFTDLRNSQTYSQTKRRRNGDHENFEMHSSGPAFNVNCETSKSKLKLNFDYVTAIPCFCLSHIQNWTHRTRHYGWPDKKLTSKLKNEIGYVVPVGFKGSRNFELEWRICYTGIEINLIHSLNETQIKMCVLLKMVAKAILKPVCKDITSYVIKNLVLWIVERNANEIFTPENLTSLVMLGLRSLRNKVNLRLFGSYMIPERNLFAGKITENEKAEMVRLLDEMLEEGPMFLIKFKELNVLNKAINETMNKPLLAK